MYSRDELLVFVHGSINVYGDGIPVISTSRPMMDKQGVLLECGHFRSERDAAAAVIVSLRVTCDRYVRRFGTNINQRIAQDSIDSGDNMHVHTKTLMV